MKNRFIVVYTVFAAAVFIFSISFFGFNLYREYTTNISKSETKYTNLVNDIRTLSYNQDNNNTAYVQGIKDAVGDAGAYSFIQVRRSGETVVLYPSGKMKDETVSKLTKSYYTSLNVNKQTVTVDCNLYLIRPDSIFYYARISFLMILIITIITIIMIIYLNLSEASSDVISMEEDEIIEDAEEDASEAEDAAEEEVSSEESDEVVEDEIIETDAPVEETTVDEAEVEQPAEASEEKHAEVTPEEVKAILSEPLTDEQAIAAGKLEAGKACAIEDAEEVPDPEPAPSPAKLPVEDVAPAPTSDEPSGLFNPETGIGWESYLLTRLNNEIDRATASEIDLSLFVIKLPSIARTSEEFKNVCNYLAIQFQFKDLLFEHKNDCIIAIKISMNVDEALKLADKLYSDICNIINSNVCRIGISSRSIRMVSGERLMLEAEQAIDHSEEASPVIAFRVDSEKYRQLMEQNQA